MKIGIVGIGCVGSAILNNFLEKKIKVLCYDKYKNIGVKHIKELIECNIIFLCLPTPYSDSLKSFDKSNIYHTCFELKEYNFSGLIVIKSTIEPCTTEDLVSKTQLRIIHNPEFLTAKSAYNDFKNQTHVVLGFPKQFNISILDELINFYKQYFFITNFSILNSTESELMKLAANSFYAVKIQYFNEIYLLSKKLDINYNLIKNTIIKNNWVNPMHTNVPGNDGFLSYGGMCFPKDTNALNQFMIRNNCMNNVINSTIIERNMLRD